MSVQVVGLGMKLEQHNWSFAGIGVAGAALNLLEIVLILKGGQYRLPFQMTILSLAVADLLTCVIIVICNVLLLTMDKYSATALVYFYVRSLVFNIMSSQLHITFIAGQRLIAVLFPFRAKAIMTPARCSLLGVLIWLSSLAAAAAVEKMSIAFSVTFMTSAFVTAFSYAFIVYRIRNRPATSNSTTNATPHVILHSGILLLLFIVSYSPIFVHFVTTDKGSAMTVYRIVAYYFLWLNSLTNLLVYFLLKVFTSGGLKCCKDQNTAPSE